MNRFLFCENINLDDNERPGYILQTTAPRMLIEVTPIDDPADVYHPAHGGIVTEYRGDGIEFFHLAIVVMFDEADEKVIFKHLKKAWKWYKAYLIKTDTDINLRDALNN